MVSKEPLAFSDQLMGVLSVLYVKNILAFILSGYFIGNKPGEYLAVASIPERLNLPTANPFKGISADQRKRTL
jgi:hypothetical protein